MKDNARLRNLMISGILLLIVIFGLFASESITVSKGIVLGALVLLFISEVVSVVRGNKKRDRIK